MRNVRLDELQTGVKISERNITNLRHEDGTILMAEIEDGASPFDEGAREGESSGLKVILKKKKNKKLSSWNLVPLLHDK